MTDANTGDAVNGAQVASTGSGGSGISAAAPGNRALPGGFYWLFSAQTGNQQFTATGPGGRGYATATATVTVAANALTRQDWALKAARLSSAGGISATVAMGSTATGKVTLTNNGTAPADVTLAGQDVSVPPDISLPSLSPGRAPKTAQPAARRPPAAVAPLHRIKVQGHIPRGALTLQFHSVTAAATRNPGPQLRQPTPSDAPWANIPGYPSGISDNYPTGVADNAVAADPVNGLVYSVGGFNGNGYQPVPAAGILASGYVYDPSTQQWSPIASAPQALEAPAAAFLGGKMYLAGGWDGTGNVSSRVYAYDPGSDSWSQAGTMPLGLAAASTAVLDGQMYLIGGCPTGNCAPVSDAVYRYDPGSNRWTQLASYPTAVEFAACAGIDGEIVCAGGLDNSGLKSTYIYHPSSNAWTQGADMPYDDWGMAYSGANNELQIAAGSTDNSSTLTNQAAQYDPVANTWTALPNANYTEYRGGGACGLYQVGGAGFNAFNRFVETPYADALPGYGQCDTGNGGVPWLSESPASVTLAPGQSATITVTMNADEASVTQPGAYTARLVVESNTPYQQMSVPVTMNVTPPRTWGEIAGTVTGANGKPLAGATVQIGTLGGTGQVSYTLTTDASGHYQLWLDHRYSPLQVIAGDSGYVPQIKTAKITEGNTTTLNFALQKS